MQMQANRSNFFFAYYDMALDECIRLSSVNETPGQGCFKIAEMNGEIYVFGLQIGANNIHKYIPHTNQWTVVNLPKNNKIINQTEINF